ncbi:hypothetical protein LSH36_443g04068 [Paralvinella palmiformis]|uniref:DDE-1 domain-containing protein n=1 Tax=Paralvinella palmiformis TaxID=53620 RepID=A0AAD9JAT2_9ANNE|nr:hypothetical protein LSH36_443g04068 [Paralvinella palmiformis]
MFRFPRKKKQPGLMVGTLPQSVGYCSPNGWTDSNMFLKWLKHFVQFTNGTKEVTHIIVLDGHHSHKTLGAVTYAKEQGIQIIIPPPHCTHIMQPLD